MICRLCRVEIFEAQIFSSMLLLWWSRHDQGMETMVYTLYSGDNGDVELVQLPSNSFRRGDWWSAALHLTPRLERIFSNVAKPLWVLPRFLSSIGAFKREIFISSQTPECTSTEFEAKREDSSSNSAKVRSAVWLPYNYAQDHLWMSTELTTPSLLEWSAHCISAERMNLDLTERIII